MFPVTKVRIPSSRVMAQQHHRQVSKGHNHCAMLSEKSPTVSREAYIQEKNLDIEKMRMICWHTIVLVETHSIFTISGLLILVTSVLVPN